MFLSVDIKRSWYSVRHKSGQARLLKNLVNTCKIRKSEKLDTLMGLRIGNNFLMPIQPETSHTGCLKVSGIIRSRCAPFRKLPHDGFTAQRPHHYHHLTDVKPYQLFRTNNIRSQVRFGINFPVRFHYPFQTYPTTQLSPGFPSRKRLEADVG